ncbi:acyltransferase [Vibrio harveyi]|uniref:acyltransferase n=1 Tax=Vibrio harveyi TaxID=669 RepID=UPI0023F63C56|nr:acyltransferase [Vibrio harveyi]MDF6013768.1 acyltransferase [Vibrio harveyi]WVM81085.1 acyltransferase [Vibrio harveyi]
MILLAYRKFMKILLTIFYKIVFFRKLKVNPFKSYLHGFISIKSGSFFVSNGFRNKRNVNISIDGGSLTLGKNVFFNNDVSINCREMINIGDNSLLGEGVKIYDHDHSISEPSLLIRNQGFKTKPVNIGKNVWLGSNVIILKGVSIGDNSVIAAGSIVTKDIDENCIYIQKRNSIVINRYV